MFKRKLTEKTMEIGVEINKVSFSVDLTALSMKEKISFENCSLFVQWSRGNYKDASSPMEYDIGSGRYSAETGLTEYQFACGHRFSRVSSFRWNKMDVI
jgi:hypothetical protein